MKFMVSSTRAFYDRLKSEAEKAGMGISEYIRFAVNMLWEMRKGDR